MSNAFTLFNGQNISEKTSKYMQETMSKRLRENAQIRASERTYQKICLSICQTVYPNLCQSSRHHRKCQNRFSFKCQNTRQDCYAGLDVRLHFKTYVSQNDKLYIKVYVTLRVLAQVPKSQLASLRFCQNTCQNAWQNIKHVCQILQKNLRWLKDAQSTWIWLVPSGAFQESLAELRRCGCLRAILDRGPASVVWLYDVSWMQSLMQSFSIFSYPFLLVVHQIVWVFSYKAASWCFMGICEESFRVSNFTWRQ